MNFLQFQDIVMGRRSIRKFTDQEVALEDIEDILNCARYAPSDTNSQTWEFIVIRNTEKIKEIEQMTWRKLDEAAAQATEKGLSREARLLTRSFGPYATAFANAPVLIICLATPYTSKFKEKIFDPIALADKAVWMEEGIKSSSLAAQNLMLAAYAKGLGSCPMTGPVLLAEDELRCYLHIEGDRRINMVIALGHPAERPAVISRKPLSDIMRIVE